MADEEEIIERIKLAGDEEKVLVEDGFTVSMLSNLLRRLGREKEMMMCRPGRRLLLVDGRLRITEHHGQAHQITTRALERLICEFDLSFEAAGHGYQLIATGSSRVSLSNHTSLATDAGFRPRRVPIASKMLDLHGVPIPVLAVEVSASQGYGSSWMDKVAAHLSSPAVKMVIAVKLVEEGRTVRQMYACVFDHADQVPGQRKPVARRVMSLGPCSDQPSRDAILQHTRVDPMHFHGVGLGGGLACSAAGMPEYAITVPADYVWHGVPLGERPPAARDMHIDLFKVIEILRYAQLLA